MVSAKDIVLRPIDRKDADAIIRRVHFSGTVVNNSQVHIGVFLAGRLEGAMQFGPSLDKRKIQGLVSGTGWNDFIELNRMAFTDALPRNSESRALSIALKMLRQHAPHLQWVITFADGTRCGDGTIYRATGFALTGIKKNNQIWEAPAGPRELRTSLTEGTTRKKQQQAVQLSRVSVTKGGNILETGGASMRSFIEAGFKPLPGHQLRYIYFLDHTAHERLTVPILPYSAITDAGAGMYRGQPRAGSLDSEATVFHTDQGGATPIPALHEDAA